MSDSLTKYRKKQTAPLIGGTIVGIAYDDTNDDWALRVKKDNAEYIVWILQDDEGNGPGSLEIETEETS